MQGLYSLMTPAPPTGWAPEAQHLWQAHYSYLRSLPTLQTFLITDRQSTLYEGDYWGLLEELRVDRDYHPFVTMFNGYTHPSDYLGTVETVLVPDLNEVALILKINRTVTT